MDQLPSSSSIGALTSAAVASYWQTRRTQQDKQALEGRVADTGQRSAATGGAHMNGFIQLFSDVIIDAGVSKDHIYWSRSLELPGYFRPTKEWDLLVVKNDQLIAAIEAKSQVGPSFGNNFNNRTEEAMGSSLDLWTAFREGAFKLTVAPFVGYFFMLEDCAPAKRPIGVKQPHFPVLEEFKSTSYAQRYELFCRKLVRERCYTASAFIMSESEQGQLGAFSEPAPDLTMESFVRVLAAHVAAHA